MPLDDINMDEAQVFAQVLRKRGVREYLQNYELDNVL